MVKKTILAVIAVFLLWTVLDFVIHGIVLGQAYAEQAEIWRPLDEMKRGLTSLSVLLKAIAFCMIYTSFVGSKTMGRALGYGLLFGIALGISMGLGSYSVMPVSARMAVVWFAGSVVEAVLGGWFLGLIIEAS